MSKQARLTSPAMHNIVNKVAKSVVFNFDWKTLLCVCVNKN
jgi:hypothetical protein